MNELCVFCDYYLSGSRYTIEISDHKSSKAVLQGHETCTSEAMNKIKSYKDYQKLSINELLKRLNVTEKVQVQDI